MHGIAAGSVRRGTLVLVLILAACGRGSSAPAPAPEPSGLAAGISPSTVVPSSSSPSVVQSAPPVAPSAQPVAPSAEPAAPEPAVPESCMSAEDSMNRAKPDKAAPAPFSECAAGVFSHCGPEHHYCSRPLNEAVTRRARKTKPGVCCY